MRPDGRVALIRLAWRRLGWPEGAMTQARWERLGTLAGGPAQGGSRSGPGSRRWPPPTAGPSGGGSIAVVPPPEPRPLPIPGSASWQGGQVIATLDRRSRLDEWVDLDPIAGPLLVRSARPGDRFAPLGLDGRSQPLADFFRGRGVPRADRPAVPIVADTEGIIWVAGHRIAHRVRRTAATVRTLGLRYQRGTRGLDAARISPLDRRIGPAYHPPPGPGRLLRFG